MHVISGRLCITPTDLCRGSPAHIFGPGSSILDALHLLFVLVPLAICVLFGLLQSRLQSFDAVDSGPQSLLHLGDFTTEVGVVPQQLQEETHVTGTNEAERKFVKKKKKGARAVTCL